MSDLRKSGNRKLTAELVREMRRLYGEGYTQASIGKHFGVSTVQVGRIVRGESWPEVAMVRGATQAEIDLLGAKLLTLQAARQATETDAGRELQEALRMTAAPPPRPFVYKPQIPPSPLDGGDIPDAVEGAVEKLKEDAARPHRMVDEVLGELKGDGNE